MRLEFSYTEADLDEWAKANTSKPHTKTRAGWQSGLATWLVFVLVVLVVILVLLMRSRSGTDVWSDMRPLLPMVLISGLGLFIAYRQQRNQGRNLWKSNEDWQQPHAVTVDDAGVEVAGPRVVSRFLWTAFGGCAETANLFLLWQRQGVYTMLPKRAATAAQQEELRTIFRAHLTPATGGFPVMPVPAGGPSPTGDANPPPPLPPGRL
jgi:hypothetical protein